jgi:hypothetical protein
MPALLLSGPSHTEFATIPYCLNWDWVPFLSPLTSHRGYGRRILTHSVPMLPLQPSALTAQETPFLWSMPSSGMLRSVALVRTNVSEEPSASIIRVTRIGKLGITDNGPKLGRTPLCHRRGKFKSYKIREIWILLNFTNYYFTAYGIYYKWKRRAKQCECSMSAIKHKQREHSYFCNI